MKEYFFQTKRLAFRAWRDQDLDTLAEINADPNVMEYFPTVMDRALSHEMLLRLRSHFEKFGYGFFATELIHNQTLIGFIGLSNPRFKSFFTPCVEIGWRLHINHWGQGYATEGAKACLRYGFEQLGIEEIFSFTTTENTRSENVMKKIGMKKLGYFDHPNLLEADHLRKHVVYKIDSKSFQSTPTNA